MVCFASALATISIEASMTVSSHSPGVALVTGAADRIGAAIARGLAAAGYQVVIHYRSSADDAEKLAASIPGEAARAIRADLSDRVERNRLVSDATELFGPLRVLVNNASSFVPDAIEDISEDLWDAHFSVHAEAPVFLARDFARQLPEGMEGNVINIIDERVLHLSPAYLSYTLSKSVLWTATRTLAQSLAPRIRVNAIGPGPTLRHQRQTEAEFQQSIAELPLRRGARPQDIADAVLYLLAARSVTGQMLALDGGEHLAWPEKSGRTPRA